MESHAYNCNGLSGRKALGGAKARVVTERMPTVLKNASRTSDSTCLYCIMLFPAVFNMYDITVNVASTGRAKLKSDFTKPAIEKHFQTEYTIVNVSKILEQQVRIFELGLHYIHFVCEQRFSHNDNTRLPVSLMNLQRLRTQTARTETEMSFFTKTDVLTRHTNPLIQRSTRTF